MLATIYASTFTSALAGLVLTGSVGRLFAGHPREDDSLWALLWLYSLSVVSYRLRFFLGITQLPEHGPQATTALGLHVLMTLLALGVIWERYKRTGFRW